jgi:hypothetical protein
MTQDQIVFTREDLELCQRIKRLRENLPVDGRIPFPVWMTAVTNAMCEITNRLVTTGAYTPPPPALGPTTYAIYADIDPSIAAVLIMRDGLDAYRRQML